MLKLQGAWRPACAALLVTMVACGDDITVTPPPPSAADMASPSVVQDSITRYLAYQHTVQVATKESEIPGLFDSLQATCHRDTANLCAVLKSNIYLAGGGSASLEFRVKHDGIAKLITVLSGTGEITNRSTTSEDLAGPIHDGERKLAMLNDYRSRLEGLRSRAANDIDALIKLNHELADVQNQIEAMSGQQAHLNQRVDTEILSVTITATHSNSFWKPVGQAFGGFGVALSQGISFTITTVALLAPCALIGWVIWWGVRRQRRGKM